ncbi:hypothetical protein AGMMS50225_13460 [Betaproteobacteria bacterium]|nr:hypothetical protein AGMMS50225_13460 [Betaproteobacteria bacterium]
MGNLLGVYPARKGVLIGMVICGTVIALIGLLILAFAWQVASGAISYRGSGNPLVLLGSIGGVVLLGGVVFVYLPIAHRPRYYFELHDDGIVVKRNKGGDASLRFAEIEDVLHYGAMFTSDEGFRTSHLSFRKNSASEWFTISPQYVDHFDLMNRFGELHIEQRGGVLFDGWEKTGAPIAIQYVSVPALVKKELWAPTLASYLASYATAKTLQLARDHIQIEGKRIDFDRDDKVEVGGALTDKIYLKDSKGEEKFSIHYGAVLSADVFVALLSSRLEDAA